VQCFTGRPWRVARKGVTCDLRESPATLASTIFIFCNLSRLAAHTLHGWAKLLARATIAPICGINLTLRWSRLASISWHKRNTTLTIHDKKNQKSKCTRPIMQLKTTHHQQACFLGIVYACPPIHWCHHEFEPHCGSFKKKLNIII